MNSFLDLLFTRHSVREFTGEPVSEEDLETIVRVGMAAPSAVNIQPWAFVIITDRAELDSLSAKLPYAKMLDKASAAIVVCGNPEKDPQFARKFWVVDCAAATENILLAVHSLGYGAVWTAVYPEEKRIDIVRKACGLPDTIIPLNVIPIGVPRNKDARAVDKFKEENIHWNTW
ncbi:MAG: nitroreductase family protein [Spirochaetae bacterium HGW-Spirochaetae-3]|jgi:nitroreductase|nr:MAG: nitroreductase family protein [Spirochaetae bacterium HGW-Spirochaetae-3]